MAKRRFRRKGVFLGDRTSDGLPVPEFIGARSEDLPALLTAILARMAMADARVSVLITLVRQNGGLSRRRRDGDFADLTEKEAKAVEQLSQKPTRYPRPG